MYLLSAGANVIVTQDLHTSKGGTICRLTFLPPANKVCEGYVFTPVCHSVHRGAGGLPNPPPMQTPSRCRPPPDADPLQMQTCHAHPHAYPPPIQMQTPWMQTCHAHPHACTTPTPDADPPLWDTTGYGQQAGGTHHTEMHTCDKFNNKYYGSRLKIGLKSHE